MSERLRDQFCISIPNFVKIVQTVEISRFCDFLKMAAAAILDFQKFKILTFDPLPGTNVRHHTQVKARVNRIDKGKNLSKSQK